MGTRFPLGKSYGGFEDNRKAPAPFCFGLTIQHIHISLPILCNLAIVFIRAGNKSSAGRKTQESNNGQLL